MPTAILDPFDVQLRKLPNPIQSMETDVDNGSVPPVRWSHQPAAITHHIECETISRLALPGTN